jgi:hypothetical protein
MKKAIFAMLAVLGVSLATGALAPTANAYTFPFASNHSDGGGVN